MIRPAEPRDAAAIAAVERAAGRRFEAVVDTSRWTDPVPGERLRAGGDLLVADGGADGEGGERGLVGFVHLVRPVPGWWHLEQISVHPDHQGRGIGGDLLDAAESLARDAGAHALTLRTYRDVPWNGPWYAARGYEVLDPSPSALSHLVDTERAAGLLDGPERVTMARRLVDPVPARPAVSVIPLRDGAGGLEVFVQHRAATMDFAAGAVVFPGGRVDPVDTDPVDTDPAGDDPAGSDLDLAAWRHTSLAADPTRLVVAAHRAGVRELAEETGHRVDLADLLAWDCWVTPAVSPKRFDVVFFVLPCGPEDELRNTTTEAVRAGWEPVADLLLSGERGEVRLMTPTRVILTELASFGSVADVVGRRPEIVPGRRDGATRRPRRDRWDQSEGETGDRAAP